MQVITIASQKGGCGKTTTTMNLAAVLGKAGKRVLLGDLDPQGTLSKSLGVNERRNLFKDGPEGLPTKLPNVDLVPGGPELVKHEMALTVHEDFGVLRRVLSGVRGYDYILLDCPPNLYGSTTNAIVAADRLLSPTPLSAMVIQSLSDTSDLMHSLGEKGFARPDWIAGVVTIYRKLPTEGMLTRIAQSVFPELLDTRIRMSTVYSKAEMKLTAAAAVGNKNSAPLVDHLRLVQEMKLL